MPKYDAWCSYTFTLTDHGNIKVVRNVIDQATRRVVAEVLIEDVERPPDTYTEDEWIMVAAMGRVVSWLSSQYGNF